ncbi:tyrosine-protein phosphatase non-receptor type 3 isoform X2 [Misgurnus anguillicaudatus]|uniref:tyrosine-protein phosphatase non-receptor type 3 isoform X2 n=1 Tax=Misgurnus anguillicaudatus TaxID=75329 RepID=UPI002435AD7E|nr:tyrosine-protein phosphatase non-receptor type 3 isoform X2 [Misgurnus anguillicaudatus]
MTSPWCVLGNKITSLGWADLSKHTHMPHSGLICVVLFPDGTTQNFTVNKNDAGHLLFDLACEQLKIIEKQYFSLQISEDTSSSPRWLDPNKPFKKQLKGSDPFFLIFRVRFFISDPNSLQHEQTRHFYFLQIKKDICEGRLKCPLSSAVVLASYAVQSELGDYVPETPPGYLSHTHFIPDQDHEFIAKVESLHPQHKGLCQSEAELCYLNTARTLDLYGVELHNAQDIHNPSLWVGITSGGVALFSNLICTSFFPWINIIKMSFKKKGFSVHLRRKHGELGNHVVSISIPSSRACKNLWRSCVDHHTFFNRKPSPAASKLSSVYLYRKLIGEKMLNPAVRSSSSEHLETKSLPSRSPPSTPNWRSPRLRHDVRKRRPSSVDNLTSEMGYVTASEDVFFTYRKNQEEGKTSGSWSHSDDVIAEEDDLHLWDNTVTAEGDLLLVRISPDQDGKFGFNVKGGVDQRMPLAISHVNPASPAGQCVPPLMEGDQVLLINGRDISEHTHQQVVMFIKASRESHSKELALLVRRKGVSLRAEPTLQLGLTLPGEISPMCSRTSGETLEESMTRLEKGLVTGTLLLQFETKCHQYWPHPPEVRDYGYLQVCCHSEECNLAYVTREITLTNTKSGQQRSITHLQYVAWPDHGVPEDSSDFLDFVQSVRSMRRDSVPLMVHCSAGIGRTGVLITMETALTLMENEKPVYPLEIITLLREQRAMLVQASCQFSFVCEAILRVYREKFKQSQTPKS